MPYRDSDMTIEKKLEQIHNDISVDLTNLRAEVRHARAFSKDKMQTRAVVVSLLFLLIFSLAGLGTCAHSQWLDISTTEGRCYTACGGDVESVTEEECICRQKAPETNETP